MFGFGQPEITPEQAARIELIKRDCEGDVNFTPRANGNILVSEADADTSEVFELELGKDGLWQ
jgi:hypothetical protein